MLFFLVPRFGSMWTVPLNNTVAETGVSDEMSPGLMVSLKPVAPALVSIGTDQNGEAMRGKKNHMTSASGTASTTTSPGAAMRERTSTTR